MTNPHRSRVVGDGIARWGVQTAYTGGMQARDRRTDDYTDAIESAGRENRDTIRIDPPVPIEDVESPQERRRRLATVHEGPVHRRHVGRGTPVPHTGDALEPLELQDLGAERAAILDDQMTAELDALPDFSVFETGLSAPGSVPEDAAGDDDAPAAAAEDGDDIIELEPQAEIIAEPPVKLPLRRASEPSIKLASGILRLVDAHNATTDHTRKSGGRRDRPTEQFSTQEMVPVSGSPAAAQWDQTAVGPMPAAPAKTASGQSGAIWIVVAAVLVISAAALGGWLLFRAFDSATPANVAESKVINTRVAVESTPAPRVPATPPQSELSAAEAPTPEPAADDVPPPAPLEPIPAAAAEPPVAAPRLDAELEDTPPVAAERPKKRRRRAAGPPGAEATHMVTGTGDDPSAPWLALRKRPRTSSTLRAKMADGTLVKVLRVRAGWVKLRVESGPATGRTGWASAHWLNAL